MKRVMLATSVAAAVSGAIVWVTPATASASTGADTPTDRYHVICVSNTVGGIPLPDVCVPDPLEA